MDMANPKRPHSPSNSPHAKTPSSSFDEAAAKCRTALANASDEHLEAKWKFSYGDQVISNGPRSLAFRQMCFDHLIHHTAQLGVYLRLNDIPVPALYGPSADEQW